MIRTRFLRAFGIAALLVWALLITVWMGARTIVAVEVGKRAWDALTRDPVVTDTVAIDTSMTAPDTAMTDTTPRP